MQSNVHLRVNVVFNISIDAYQEIYAKKIAKSRPLLTIKNRI